MKVFNPLISIILPNYNHGNYLEQRLDSIFNQSYENFEVIILDDCSTDSSLDILNLYREHPKVSNFIVNEKNSGSPFKQWQKGLALSHGEFIWIAESDDYCELDFLEEHIRTIQDGSADLSVAKTIISRDGILGKTVSHPIFRDIPKEQQIMFCPILNVSSIVFKSKLLKLTQHPTYTNYKLIGDRVFYFEYFRNAYYAYTTNSISYFRKGLTSVSDLKNKEGSYFKTYFDEHWQFINYASKVDESLTKVIVKQYIKKFYGSVRDKVSKVQKKKLSYLRLYLSYKIRLFARI